MLSGLVNVPVYALVVHFSYPSAGLWLGTALALLISAGSGYLTYLFIQSRVDNSNLLPTRPVTPDAVGMTSLHLPSIVFRVRPVPLP